MLRNFGAEWSRNKQKKNYGQSFQFLNINRVILWNSRNFSSFCTRKRVVIKPLKYLNRIDISCLGYCILGVAGRLLKES